MPESLVSFLAILSFMLLPQKVVIANHYVTTYLQDSCRCKAIDELRCESFTLDLSARRDHLPERTRKSSGLVRLSRDPRDFGREFYCTLVIRAPPYVRISARITSLDLPPAPGHFPGDSLARNPHRYVVTDRRGGKTDGEGHHHHHDDRERKGLRTVSGCVSSVLQIYDGPSSKDFRDQLVGICGSDLPQQNWFESSGSHMTLYYQHGPEVADDRKSFDLAFTLFTRRENGCHDDEFQCIADSSCIPYEAVCDGVENCRDGSDEGQGFDLCQGSRQISDPLIGGMVASGIFLSLILMLVLSVSCNRRRKNKDGPPTSQQQQQQQQQRQGDKLKDVEVSFDDVGNHVTSKVARSQSSVTYANLAAAAPTPTDSTERTALVQTLPRSSSNRRAVQTNPGSPSSPLRQNQGHRKVTPRLGRRNDSDASPEVVGGSRQVLGSILGSTVRPIIIDAQSPTSVGVTPTEIRPTGTTLILYSDSINNSINNIPLYSPRFLRRTDTKLLSPTHPPSYDELFPDGRKK